MHQYELADPVLHNDNLENEHFIAIPSICNQRSLTNLAYIF